MKAYLRVIRFSVNRKMCAKMSFVIGLFIAVAIFSSASKGESYIHAMGDEVYDIKDFYMKDFCTGIFNVPVANRTRLQKIVKFWRLRKRLSIDLEGNLLYEKKKVVKKSDLKRNVAKTFIKNETSSRKIRPRAADCYSGIF